MTSPKIALLGAILESNRFAPPAERADFTSLTWLSGQALMAEARSMAPKLATEFAAFVRAMDSTGEWTPVPCLLAASHPAGPVQAAVIEEIIVASEETLRAVGSVDAVYVCNHGAMVAEHDHDPDGLLLSRIRAVVGPEVPIVATLDLHANVSARMVEACDLIVGYRTNPRHPYTKALLAEAPRLDQRRREFAPIEGEIPSPLDPPPGCTFHPRCPVAAAACRVTVPKLKPGRGGRETACLLEHAETV